MTEVVETETTRTVIVENTVTGVVEVTASGPTGAQGPAGLGLPAGGITGQVLVKKSSINYDTEWSAAAGLGTVTSVALTGPTGFSITGSPITTSGTLAISFSAGYSLPTTAKQTNWDTAYNWGNHALAGYALAGTNSDITSLVGITGGIATVDYITYDTAVNTTPIAGQVGWNTTFGTNTRALGNGTIILDGMDVVAYCANAEATTLTRGTVVYISGSTGSRAEIKRASNTTDNTSVMTIGFVKDDIAPGASGYIVTQGVVEHLNLGAYAAGDIVYLGATAGTFTNIEPFAPNHIVILGVVERANAGNGQIYVKVSNGWELKELHDVQITGTPTSGSLIIRDATNALWKNARLTAGTGVSITNADASVTITNNAPDQTVALTAGTGITTSGTYPNFTITNSAPDQVVALTAGTNITISGTYPNFTISASGGGGGSGTVTSVGLTAPTGFSVTGSPVTTSGTLALAFATGYSLPTTASQANWDTAYTDRLKWDGGSSGLTASTGRASLGSSTLGDNLFTITNPSAITFPRFNADNTVSALDAATFRTAIGAGTGNGTVTSVGITAGTGVSVSGGPITGSGSITVTNTAPDQIVVLTQSGTTTITGTYPNFTISSADQYVGTVTSIGLTAGTGISISGGPITSSGSITVTNSAPMIYPGSGIAVSTGSAWGTSLTAPSGAIVGTTDTQTLTSKRVSPRVSTTTSSATPTINTDNVDVFGLTAQAVDITSFTTNLSGTPTDGQKLWIYIVGTAARAITWGASFEASTVALPTTTVSTNRLDVGFVWNAATSKWRCMGTA